MIAAGALIVIETQTSPRSIPCEQRLHVVERVDRDALAPDLAERARMVGVVAHQRRHVERRATAPSGRGRAGSGSARWSPPPCRSPRTGASSTTGPRYMLGYTPRVNGNSPGSPIARVEIRRQVGLRVQRPDRLPRERGERDVALGVLPLLSGHALSLGAGAVRRMRAMRSKPRSSRVLERRRPRRRRAPSTSTPPRTSARTVATWSGPPSPSTIASCSAVQPSRLTWSRSMPASSSRRTIRGCPRSAARISPVPS